MSGDLNHRIVRWSPDELVAFLKAGERPREVLITDRIPEDATVVGVRKSRGESGGLLVEVCLHSDHWPRMPAWELPVKFGLPPDPWDALRLASEAFMAREAFDNHVDGCPDCDGFQRCGRGSDLGVAWFEAKDRVVQALIELRLLGEIV